MAREMLQPAVALAAWTMVMWAWMLARRLPAMRKAGITFKGLVGGRGADGDRVLPGPVQWPSHNYNHLLEQPTVFYAIIIMIALLGANDFPTRVVAWGYVTFRILHSLWQATVNQVTARFALFGVYSLLLIALIGRAALAVWGVAVPY